MVEQENVHIDYGKEVKLYHIHAAELAAKYGPDKEARVLDYGCGVGHTLVALKEMRPEYRICIADAYQECIDITSSRVDIETAYRVSDSQEVQEISKGFDIIILSHVIEHTRDPIEAIANCRSMLKDDGILVLVAPNVLSIRCLAAVLRGNPNCNEGHVMAWDEAHWKNFIRNFSSMNVLEFSHDEAHLFSRLTPINSIRKKIEVFICRLFPGISFSHFAVLKK